MINSVILCKITIGKETLKMEIVKYTKIILVVLMMLYMCFVSTQVYANPLKSADDVKNAGSEFINTGSKKNPIKAAQVAELIKPITNILLGIGTVVIIGVAGIMGVKYVTGSPEQHAKLKTQLLGLAVSIVVLYGAYGIWAIVFRALTDLTS